MHRQGWLGHKYLVIFDDQMLWVEDFEYALGVARELARKNVECKVIKNTGHVMYVHLQCWGPAP